MNIENDKNKDRNSETTRYNRAAAGSFEKLKHIATSNIYRHYLTKNRRGKWEINDNFFRDFTSVAWCVDCVTQEDWDEAYMRQIYENWERGRR